MRQAAIIGAALAFWAGTPAPAQVAAVDEVIAAERAFAADAQTRSVKTSFAAAAAPNGVAVRPSGVVNVQEFIASWPDEDDAGTIQWYPDYAGVAQSGDLGFTTGPARGPWGNGTYLTVWQRQADGGWRWVIDMGSDRATALDWHPDGAVTTLAFLYGPPQDPETAWAALSALDAEIDTSLAGGADMLARHLAVDSRLTGIEADPAIGMEAWQAALAARPRMTARHEGGGVSAAGDFGWTYGYAEWEGEGGAVRSPYLRIWQRRSEGWTIVIDNTPSFPG